MASAVEQQAGYNTDKVRAARGETAKTRDTDGVTINSTADRDPRKNVHYDLEALSGALSAINLFQEG